MNCKICENSVNNSFLQVRDMMFQVGDMFEYMHCSKCGCLQIVEIPKNLSDYYPSDYYSFKSDIHKKGFSSSLKSFIKQKKYKYAVEDNSLLGKLIYYLLPDEKFYSLKYLPYFDKDTSFLDIGSGSGDLLKGLKAIGYKNLNGIDPYINQDEIIDSNLKILKKNIFQLDSSEKYDVIMFHHVFEHLSEPLEILKIVYSLLSENGVCMIRIPVADSFAFKNYKENWVQLDAPRHLFIHTRKSMEIITQQANMEIIKVIDDSNDFQFWGSEQYQRNIPLFSEKSLANRKLSRIANTFVKNLKNKANKLNQVDEGDQTVFIIKKNK